MTPMNYYDALDAKAQRIYDALQRYHRQLKQLVNAEHPVSTADLSALSGKVLEGRAQLDAIKALQMRLVSDDTTDRAYRHALDELTDLARLTPFQGPDETRRRAAIEIYGDFLKSLAPTAQERN